MNKLVSFALICALLLTACSSSVKTEVAVDIESIEFDNVAESEASEQEDISEANTSELQIMSEQKNNFDISVKGLDDEALLQYVEDGLYSELVEELNSEDYFVENVEAIYYPKEYIEALASNSQSNLYFGYTAQELDEQFQGTKYVFTLGSDGQTCVVPMETLTDDIYVKALEDVIVGSGVILVCVTVSIVSAPTAPAVSMIFAASATTGTSFAMESGTLSFVAATIAKGYETENFEQAIQAGIKAGGEGFKWGAITGVAYGGATEGIALKGATVNGLTMNEAATIQKETKWPLDIVKALHSYDEFTIYRKAGLQPIRLGSGKFAFAREIDWNLVDSKGRTNVQRVAEWGLAPIDEKGVSYDLHHVGQKADSPLAILTWDEHHSKGNYSILHYAEEGKGVADDVWRQQKNEFWNDMLKIAREQGKV